MARALVILLMSAVLAGCASGPEALMRRHAYEGPRKPGTDLATVFARWAGPNTEQTYICAVDEKSYRITGPISPCPSVVYVPAGPHVFELENRLGFRFGTALITLNTAPGRTYEVRAQFHDAKYTRFGSREMPRGYVLTYRDLAPSFFVGTERPNRPVSADDSD